MILHELLGKVSDKTRISIYFAGTLSDYKSRREVPARLWNCESPPGRKTPAWRALLCDGAFCLLALCCIFT